MKQTEHASRRSDLSKFDQVQLGIPAAEVKKLLGEPTRTYSKGADQKSNYWSYDRITVKIDENSKVSAKGLEVADANLTLAAIENRYGVKDLELVQTVVGCNGLIDKLGADIYRSQELGAEISVSFKGDIQRFVQNDELKTDAAQTRSRPICRAKH